MENKVLVGVSGGPDSMFLLNKLNKDKKIVPIALHVNYHLRQESDIDESIVIEYCKEHQIELKILNIKSDNWEQVSFLKNKQAMARKLRFDFYLQESILNDIHDVYIAHHKDDFIETAIMQKERSKDLLFYGIKEISNYGTLNIIRPLLNVYKEDIILTLQKMNISFSIDKTNEELIYERNIIRNILKNKTKQEKNAIFESFSMINETNRFLIKEIDINYHNWIEKDYDWDFFNKIEEIQKRHVIFKLLTRFDERINISSDKLNSVVKFLETQKINKSYRLMENIFITTKNSKIVIQTKYYGNRK